MRPAPARLEEELWELRREMGLSPWPKIMVRIDDEENEMTYYGYIAEDGKVYATLIYDWRKTGDEAWCQTVKSMRERGLEIGNAADVIKRPGVKLYGETEKLDAVLKYLERIGKIKRGRR